jgi:glutathione S-transferase
MRRLSLPIETRDAQAEGPFREELIAGGGRAMVPCLRIAEANGDARWLYESSTILAYLRERFDA